ncbi:Rne/Rng family ribonuclease [Clostridiaceae bacterium M8S5]|nr:Rne/Rng family ribonuclease [Clostridiaceae bacterium M8S5]
MNQIIIDDGVNQKRAAVVEDNRLVELYIEREDTKRTLGNIYKGRVVNVLPGMQAAFVDIGLVKNAFLYVKDAVKSFDEDAKKDVDKTLIQQVVKVGQEIIVQVIKEPYGSKGARVTTEITFPGRYLVYMPNNDYVGISRKIIAEKERVRLKDIADELRNDEKFGLILRTVAENKTKEEIQSDLEYLKLKYKRILREKNLGRPPKLIHEDLDVVERVVRDIFSYKTDKLVINNYSKYNDVLEEINIQSPVLSDKVEFFDLAENIFEHYKIQSQIDASLDKKVWLENGGYLVIDETEALTVIDVNTGKYIGSSNLEDTVFQTNLEASKEIARQIRLRNIGGIIIIDFIDMYSEEDDNKVLEELEKNLKKDRIRTTVLGMTKLGLVEMTRKKTGKRLSSRLLRYCPYCGGKGKIQSEYEIVRQIESEVKRINEHTCEKNVLFSVHPYYYDIIIKNHIQDIDKIKETFGINIYFKEDETQLGKIKILRVGSIKEIEKLI